MTTGAAAAAAITFHFIIDGERREQIEKRSPASQLAGGGAQAIALAERLQLAGGIFIIQ